MSYFNLKVVPLIFLMQQRILADSTKDRKSSLDPLSTAYKRVNEQIALLCWKTLRMNELVMHRP